ncbi:MAG: hypothetical protein WA614_12375 [Acidimicrobiales bacterium]
MATLETLKHRCSVQWQVYVTHPLFKDIGLGTFKPESMKFWLTQDLLYVAVYKRVREGLVDRVLAEPRLAPLHEKVAAPEWSSGSGEEEIDIEDALLELLGGESPKDDSGLGPARDAYINHIARIFWEGSICEVVAAILPCGAGFYEANAPFDPGRAGLPEFSRRWLEFFQTTPTLAVSTELLARSAELPGVPGLETLVRVFRRSLEHQIDVLDAAWRADDPWPSEKHEAERFGSLLQGT